MKKYSDSHYQTLGDFSSEKRKKTVDGLDSDGRCDEDNRRNNDARSRCAPSSQNDAPPQNGGSRSRWTSQRPGSRPISKPSSALNTVTASFGPIDSTEYPLQSGILELHPNGFGYLRDPKENCVRLTSDPFVAKEVVEEYALREGIRITARIHPNHNGRGPRLMEMIDIDGFLPDDYAHFTPFTQQTPVNPESWLRLESANAPLSARVLDILTPLGKGQRALIVAPPHTGKTVLLQQICHALTTNYPEMSIVALFVGERPEEVVDFQRAIQAEVFSDGEGVELENLIRIAQFVIERCKRLVEMGKDVFLLLDSMTCMARGFCQWSGNNAGRSAPRDFDVSALDIPKQFFSLARQNKGGGSLTIIGTIMVDTNRRLDDLIYEEFQRMGNMKIVLDQELADYCVWPAINIYQSGTRFEEKLLPPKALRALNMLRRRFMRLNPVGAMEFFAHELADCETNIEFCEKIISFGDGNIHPSRNLGY